MEIPLTETLKLFSKTRNRILVELSWQELTISQLAKILDQTEANMSAQVMILEKAGLVNATYKPGAHGVKKVCRTTTDRIIIPIKANGGKKHDGE